MQSSDDMDFQKAVPTSDRRGGATGLLTRSESQLSLLDAIAGWHP